MVAFEIRVNGEPVSTIVAGQTGSLTAAVTWSGEWWRWFQGEEFSLRLEGRDAGGGEPVWPATTLRPGDEVSIRLTEAAPSVTDER